MADTTPVDSPATLRVPVCIAAASLTAVVAWGLAFGAVALEMSVQAVVVFASVATVAGCSILAAIVVVCCRKASRDMQAILSRKLTRKVDQLADDIGATSDALRSEVVEQHRQTRIAQYTLTGEMAAGETPRLRPVK